MLTGKAKADFRKYVESKGLSFALQPLFLNALIIEWFDSVEIYIHTKRNCMGIKFNEWYFIITNKNGIHYNNHVAPESRIKNDCRQQATEAAIKAANEIYNAKNN